MDSIASTLATNQAAYQTQIGMAVMKMAAQSDLQVAALVVQSAQAGQALAANPAHLGQSLDTFA
jgi:hypothetical protein